MKILIIVESYWGAGHMGVTAQAAQALIKKGHKVFIAASERSFELGENYDFSTAQKIVFPNILKDDHNRYIIAPSGRLVCDDPITTTNQRLDILKSAHETIGFDRALFEEWPFGVNIFDHTFTAFATYLNSQRVPMDGIVRDVLGYPEPRHNDARHHDLTSVTLSNLFLQNIYIAADKNIITLNQSLHPGAAQYLSRYGQHYVGFFGAQNTPKKSPQHKSQRPIILASGGSFKGAVREYMLHVITALSSSLPATKLANNPLKIIIGNEANHDDINTLKSITAHLPQTEILRNLPNHEFREQVANAAALLHKGSLNLAIDATQCGIKNIFTPMADPQNGAWAETTIRANAFTSSGYAQTLSIAELADPVKLQHALLRAVPRKKPNLKGAQTMAALISKKSKLRMG